MTEPDRTQAAVRHTRWPGWVWAVPLAALGIVIWLGVQAFLHGGPKIEVSFATAGGIKAGDTKVRYKDVEVGSVDDLKLSDDLKGVVATLRMARKVEPLLREGTRFWIVGGKLDLADLSAVKTVVSGPFIRMDPGPGKPARRFAGLDEPPPVPSGTPGTGFVLDAGRLGTLGVGAPVKYLGLTVGKLETVNMNAGGHGFQLTVFIDAPYDALVHPRSRFWDAGAMRLSTAGGGVSAEMVSPSALLNGSLAFETPAEAEQSPRSNPGDHFTLYDSRDAAESAPLGPAVRYLALFEGAVGDLSVGAPVTLKGFRVGRVIDVRLGFDVTQGIIDTPVTIALDPSRFHFKDIAPPSDGNWGPILDQALGKLVEHGLRARLTRSTPLVGGQQVSLDFVAGAMPAALQRQGDMTAIPTTSGSDISGLTAKAGDIMAKIDNLPLAEIGQSVRQSVDRVNGLVSSPEMASSLHHLDTTLANLDRTSRQASVKVGPLIDSLRQTADAAQGVVASADTVLGGGVTGQQRDLPDALHELADAARSIRSLANYLDRHPEALLQGKGGGPQ
jgi:paraquat-inducible protein B